MESMWFVNDDRLLPPETKSIFSKYEILEIGMESKNAKTLAEFTDFCKEHPEMRFWQALRNWQVADSILVLEEVDGHSEVRDSYYWE